MGSNADARINSATSAVEEDQFNEAKLIVDAQSYYGGRAGRFMSGSDGLYFNDTSPESSLSYFMSGHSRMIQEPFLTTPQSSDERAYTISS